MPSRCTANKQRDQRIENAGESVPEPDQRGKIDAEEFKQGETISIRERGACSSFYWKGFCVGETACWVIIAAVSGTWGQRDLWIDAADVLG